MDVNGLGCRAAEIDLGNLHNAPTANCRADCEKDIGRSLYPLTRLGVLPFESPALMKLGAAVDASFSRTEILAAAVFAGDVEVTSTVTATN